MGKAINKTKALIWLVIGLVMILTPMLYELMTFFPMFDASVNFGIILMHLFFAGAFLLLFVRSSKFKLNDLNIYLVVFLILLLIPLLFAWALVAPIVTMSNLLIYLLMHLVFAGGVLTLYSQMSQFRKLL